MFSHLYKTYLGNRRYQLALSFLAIAIAVGCASTRVTKNPDSHTRGVRFYRPKPYLMIQPIENDTNIGVPIQQKNDPNTYIQNKLKTAGQLRITMEWLPDFSEEYAIQPRTGVGKNNTTITLTDGWRLDQVTVNVESKTSDVIKSVAGLLGTEPKLITSLGKKVGTDGEEIKKRGDAPDSSLIVYGHQVPLGYYESVIGCGPDGKKRLHGWRYVGMAPYANCPIDMSGAACQSCETADLFGIVAVNNQLVFRKLNELAQEANSGTNVIKLDFSPPPSPPAKAATNEEIESAFVKVMIDQGTRTKILAVLNLIQAELLPEVTIRKNNTGVSHTVTFKRNDPNKATDEYLKLFWGQIINDSMKDKLGDKAFALDYEVKKNK